MVVATMEAGSVVAAAKKRKLRRRFMLQRCQQRVDGDGCCCFCWGEGRVLRLHNSVSLFSRQYLAFDTKQRSERDRFV